MNNKRGFPEGKKNTKLSEKRKQMFKDGLLNVSGERNGMFGKHLSNETKHKISLKTKGENNPNFGKINKWKDKTYKEYFGEEKSKEIGIKISNKLKGRTFSQETKNRMRESRKKLFEDGYIHPQLGSHLSEKTKQKISISNLGRKSSEETKQKLREAIKDNENIRVHQFKKGHINPNKGKSFEEAFGIEKAKEMKKIMSSLKKKQYLGTGNPAWLGGVSFEPYGIEFNEKLKNEVRKRDNQICMNCGIHREKLNRALNTHHINYDKICNFKENLISLCKKCHALTNFNREYWIKLFQDKLNKLYGYNYSLEGLPIIEIKLLEVN